MKDSPYGPTDEQHTARGQGRAPLGRNYWRLLTASGLSNLGDGIAIVALPSMNAAILVLYAQDVLGLGSVGYGLLLATVAVGMVLGAQVVPWLIPRLPPGATLVWVLAAQAVAYTAIALVPSTALFALLWVVVGFTTMWWNILTISLRQRIIPDPLLSRVLSAFRTMGLGTAAIGMALGGLTASLLESPVGRETALSTPFLLAGLISFALVVVSAQSMTTARIRAALADADRDRADSMGRDDQTRRSEQA
ncbi:MFS transporter [Nocardiopsis oceani]